MNTCTSIKRTVTVAMLLASCFSVADDRYPPVLDRTVIEECGACHMAFQPQMLPQRSWRKIMENLADHFGEDASLDSQATEHIRDYLIEGAADSKWYGGKFMRGVTALSTPLRITEMPYWIREHDEEVSPGRWDDPEIKSRANCVACHTRADLGDYDDD